MSIQYTYLDLVCYLMVYSLIGWTIEVCIDAVSNHRFVNQGLLNLPFALPYGIISVVLMLVLPTIDGFIVQFLMTCVIYRLIRGLCDHFVRRISGAERDRTTTRMIRALIN